MRKLFLGIFISVTCISFGCEWLPDYLGDNYEYSYIEQPDDYSGEIKCTVVRSYVGAERAVVYLHGYNDYFYQSEMGKLFNDSAYNFYAVDLRKYGRSLLEGQQMFQVYDLDEYFADIDSVLSVAVGDGNGEIVLMGHSTGGLTLPYYLAKGRGKEFPIKGLILNSPFLDMNLDWFTESVLLPMVNWYSYISKETKVPQGISQVYAETLLDEYHGEWSYNTDWKLKISPDVTSGWLGAIYRAQNFLQDGVDIDIPILLAYSSLSSNPDEWSELCNSADIVLDVEDIVKYGARLGDNITNLEVVDGIHDLVLSRSDVREYFYQEVFKWLNDSVID
ncbi:MAG: alpha/beta hydrolase [Bacteroidales bacterium]